IFPTKTLVHVRGANEAAVQAVSPAVVAALDTPGELAFTLRTDPRTTMAANIEKGSHGTIVVASQDDAFTGNFAQEVVARVLDLIRASRANPCLAEKAFDLILEETRIGVVPRGQRRRDLFC